MSHANGTVKFSDGLILHYEYNGTVDIACPKLYETYEEMDANWRNYSDAKCNCNKDEDVEIYTDYGTGISWNGKACRYCKAITKKFSPYKFINDYIENGFC